MNKTITIRGDTHKEENNSQAIRNYIEDYLTNLEKFLLLIKEPVFIDITIDINKPHPHHTIDLRLHGPHMEIVIKKENPELYKAIDEAMDLLKNELAEHKKKQLDLRKTADHYKSD